MKKQNVSKSATLLRSTYELYAKMLAVENIKVVFNEKISAPASFDLINRILYISPVHNAQAHLIPGLIIHEVGHALFSTLSTDDLKVLKKITKLLNIIDDGYQERQMCKKYPNTKKELFKVFDEFFLKDTGQDDPYNNPNKLISIVNILNYNCKGFKYGNYKQYPSYVLPEDVDMLREAEMINVNTLIGRDAFAKRLAIVLKKYGKMKEEDTNLDGKKESDDGEDENTSKSNGKEGGNGSAEDDVEDMLDENSDELNDHHDKFDHKMNSGKTYELPTGEQLLKLAKVKDLYIRSSEMEAEWIEPKNLGAAEAYQQELKTVKKNASRIFTQFNMRVQASNYANQQFRSSGSLDPERAALYQVYDDVFVKTAVEPNQQNHAYSVVLDWSSSMDYSIKPLVLRIMELCHFAKMLDIEIEIWLYTTDNVNKDSISGISNDLTFAGSSFIHVANTKKHSQIEMTARLKYLWYLSNNFGRSTTRINSHHTIKFTNDFTTQGTNILEGLILGQHVLAKMQADVKTCFVLSDGGDTTIFDKRYDPATNKVIDTPYNTPLKIFVNGFDLEALYSTVKADLRMKAKMAIAELYRAAGHRTVGLAWGCSDSMLTPFCDSTIRVESNAKEIKEADIAISNQFINEIVKTLL